MLYLQLLFHLSYMYDLVLNFVFKMIYILTTKDIYIDISCYWNQSNMQICFLHV